LLLLLLLYDTFFLFASSLIIFDLFSQAAAHLPTSPQAVTTPTNAVYKGHLSILDTNPEDVCAVSIVRAGDSLLECVREIAPSVRVGKMWIQRNESSADKEAVHSCTKLPKGVDEMHVLLLDPMLATGGSACAALNTLIKEYGVAEENIVFANVISCPEGLAFLAQHYPRIKVVTCWIDDCLNEDKFIVPGLGDYGDRFFNTV
jgi:uracil phosphoribosyltransferase